MPEENQNGSISYSLAPYTGVWTKAEAGHLLRRTMFGPTNQQIVDTVTNGMAASVVSLLTIPAIIPPVAYESGETITTFGNPWVADVYPTNPVDLTSTINARNLSLAVWIVKRMNEETYSIAEKMCLFWQNHFAAPFCIDPRATYDYHALIRSHALGNFKQFAKDVTINPCMLLFLNGATNTLYSPNENYARELLELFTIGKGDQIAVGDYTTYKEEDVAAGAKILTGYIVDGLVSDTIPNVTANYTALYHDTTTKTLSTHFGSVSVPNAGAAEYSNYIDIIFQQNTLAEYMCRNIYRYFVNYDLTVDVETNVIPDMAATLIANNYEILPVMTELLSSQHFYDISVRGALIKSPLDMMFSVFNSTESVPGFDLLTDSEMYAFIYSVCDVMGQSYAEPPSVAGWPAYYQEPSFSQLWLNSAYIKLRFKITDFATIYTGVPGNGNNWKLSVFTFLDSLSSPADPVAVIDDIADVFAPKGLDMAQKLLLKAILTNGLPDFEWTVQYNDYVANPGNVTFSDPVKLRIELVLQRMFQMPEFQTI